MEKQMSFNEDYFLGKARLNISERGLNNCRALYISICFLRQEIEIMENGSLVKANVYDKIKVQGGTVSNMVEKYAIRHHDNVGEMESKIKRLELENIPVKAKLKVLSKDEYRQVLTLYYLEGKSVKEVADVMGYSARHIIRLKKEALEEFSRLNYPQN